eukprot:tig00000704_g3289.t1
MAVSCGLFFLGSLPSWPAHTPYPPTPPLLSPPPLRLPASFVRSPRDLIIVASVLCFSSLFAVGVVKGRATRSSQLRSGLENVVLGGLGAALCYGIGALAGSGAARAA